MGMNLRERRLILLVASVSFADESRTFVFFFQIFCMFLVMLPKIPGKLTK